jgi:hypothetical protein
MSGDDPTAEEVTPVTALKLLLFLVWWFSGIGVGTAFMSPGVIGTAISANLLLVIILAFFCSALLIVTLIPEPGNDSSSVTGESDSGEPTAVNTA